MAAARPSPHDGAMNETTDTAAAGSGHRLRLPVPTLRRSVTDRKVAGVAGGLGRYFNVDPLIFRVVFVTLAIFGGSGLLLYAVGWLLVPEDGRQRVGGVPPGQRPGHPQDHRRHRARDRGPGRSSATSLDTGFGFGGFARAGGHRVSRPTSSPAATATARWSRRARQPARRRPRPPPPGAGRLRADAGHGVRAPRRRRRTRRRHRARPTPMPYSRRPTRRPPRRRRGSARRSGGSRSASRWSRPARWSPGTSRPPTTCRPRSCSRSASASSGSGWSSVPSSVGPAG